MSEPGAAFQSENPIVQRILAGTAPPPIRLAAARGSLPLSPEELFHVLFALREDPELEDAIVDTIRGIPDDTLSSLLRHPGLPSPLLGFFADHTLRRPACALAIVGNRSADSATLEMAATLKDIDVLELLVTNQVALIRSPHLLETLVQNPALTPDQRRRVLEVREEFVTKKEREEARRRDEEERLAKLREKKEWTLHELEKLQEDIAAEALADKEAGRLASDADSLPADETDEEFKSAQQRIINMSVPEKILLAIRGSRTERNLLIRDSNRLVATSTIKSPKVTDSEVEFFAGLRNVSDEILRIIGARREWLKNYPVILTLVKNPRTPLATSMNLLNRLQATDLKKLSGDRNVGETLRRQAKQLLEKASKERAGH